jgi:hypothetical protein
MVCLCLSFAKGMIFIMKKGIVIMLVLALILAAGCKARTGTDVSYPPESSEAASSAPESEESASEPEPESSQEEESSDIDTYEMGPYDEMLLVFGGVIEYPGDSAPYLRTSEVGLYYVGDWNSPGELDAGSYYSWYMSMMWKEGLTNSELKEKYKSPLEGDMGWFFPQDLYEAAVQKYFDVSTDYLRSERHIYDPDLEGYYLPGSSGGIGERPEIVLDEFEEEGDVVKLYISLGADKKVLTVKKESAGGFKFESFVTR